jgi:argininosuccinate lyase
VPFREAHRVVGTLVARSIGEGKDWSALTAADLQSADARFRPEDVEAMGALGTGQTRISPGGGSMASVVDQLRAVRARIAAGR